LFPLTFRNAPPLATPVPLNTNGSAPIVTPFTSSSAAPLATVVLPDVPPNARLPAARNTPCDTVTVPPNVFSPLKLNVSEPTFAKEPDPTIEPELDPLETLNTTP
jgi:hypothetical protein